MSHGDEILGPSFVERREPRGLVLSVEGFGVVGATEHGEEVGIEVRLADGAVATLLFPSRLFPKLMAGLLAGGKAAHSARLAYLGTEQMVLDDAGAEPFTPTAFQLGLAGTRGGRQALLLRLEKDGTPILDVALDAVLARGLAEGIPRELGRQASPARRKQ